MCVEKVSLEYHAAMLLKQVGVISHRPCGPRNRPAHNQIPTNIKLSLCWVWSIGYYVLRSIIHWYLSLSLISALIILTQN